MSYIVPKEIPNRCGRCPCFHAEHPMYCQAVKADKNKKIYAPYGEGRPEWCPLIEIKTPHGRLIDADMLKSKFRHGKGDDGVDSAWISTIRRFITQADTIIGAEGSKE